jgi:voltage-gated potassium channel
MKPEQTELQGISEAGHSGSPEGHTSAPIPTVSALRRPGVLRFSAVELLIALGLLFFSAPFIEKLRHGNVLESFLLTVVLISSVLAVGGRRRTLIAAILLVMPAVVGKWANHLRPDLVPPEVFLVAELVFLGFVVTNLMRFTLRAPRVNTEVLCAGMAGYLMIGLLWMVAYLLVARAVPDSFSITAGPTGQRSMEGFTAFYFSFATLTTIGYGDIIPISNTARMLAVMEAVIGMFYVATLISRLVALHTSNPPPPAAPQPPGGGL